MGKSIPAFAKVIGPFLVLATAATLGCSSNGSQVAGDSNDALQSADDGCVTPAVPSELADFQGLSSCQLKALFDDEGAKEATVRAGLPDGPFDGVPLCRKDVLRAVPQSSIPPGVSTISGFASIWKFLELSDSIDNAVASKIWHGKYFTPPSSDGSGDVLGYAEIGDVNNFIDITSGRISDDARRSAEAKYFIESQSDRRWLTLNYMNAQTGTRVFQDLSVEFIRHVYDTARLVDAERSIYLGMAWLVDEPGVYSEEPGKMMPSCYFALKKHVQ